jgi:hypothetical protein
MTFLQSLWSFLSVVVIAWITQSIITHREKRKKIEETKLAIYMSWMPFLAECYARAMYPDGQPHDPKEFLKKKMEILGTLQIMGPEEAMDAFIEFSKMAELGFAKDASFDLKKFHHSFGTLNCCLCCEIHGERQEKSGS